MELLGRVADRFVISRTATYNWVRKYRDELKKEGLIEEKRKGSRIYTYVKDVDRFIEFFQKRGVYLVDED